MSHVSRPIKLACLACRASKIRCDGQKPCTSCSAHRQECRYQPSRRGGSRRRGIAAEGLPKKRAPPIIARNESLSQGDHPSPRMSFPPSSPSVEPVPMENCNIGFQSPLNISYEPQALLGVQMPTWSIRAYCSDQDICNAYYIFIHRYFPLLPPPATAQFEDRFVSLSITASPADAANLPYWPTSCLGLALAAMLVLIPPPGNALTVADGAVSVRRAYADLFARSALDSLEKSLQPFWCDAKDPLRSSLHPDLPRRIEPVIALGLLSLYEYCQCGNIPRMRLRANQALTMAMDLGLHVEKEMSDCMDAHRRCWWATLFLVYQSSILTASPPIIPFDDPRITTPFPEFRGCREPWPILVKAQVTFLRCSCLGNQLLHEGHTPTELPRSLTDEIRHLDSSILDLVMESDRFRCVTNYQGAEADASRNLWVISNALIHTSRLTLHSPRAFPDLAPFKNRYDLLTIDPCPNPVSSTRISQINALFPFTAQESIRISLHSALVVSRIFRHLPAPNPTYSDAADVETASSAGSLPRARRPLPSPRSIPYMACCQLQSYSVLARVLWLVRAALCGGDIASCYFLLDQPSTRTKVQDAERLLEEVRHGMEALGESIRADGCFERVGSMAREVERVDEAAGMD